MNQTSTTVDEQLALFLDCLRRQRILLVLDHMESTLDGTQFGAYLPGYELYAQLLELVATRNHHSHLLITTREPPPELTRLEGDTPLVRSLRLDGLDIDAGRALLSARGLVRTTEQESKLIQRYSRNPVALKLVADTVGEMYFGDVNEFLTDETLVFDDIRLVLNQQFARLSLVEQEILFYLATDHESASFTLSEIRTNLPRVPHRKLIEALRSLQRCSLIERNESGSNLPNVIIEYLNDRLDEADVVPLEEAQAELQEEPDREGEIEAELKWPEPSEPPESDAMPARIYPPHHQQG